ncbi:helix-turn-helix domain-containing protein [Frateuria aurantia]
MTHPIRYADFADRLRRACDEHGVPPHRQRITAVASRFGVSRETVRLWFSGRTLPELSRLIEIAEEYHCSLDWLAMGRLEASPGPGAIAEPRGGYASLSSDEQSVIRVMRTMPEPRRQALVALLKLR